MSTIPQRELTLQEQINALPSGGGTILLDNTKIHYVHGPLNIRGRSGVRIIGQGYGTQIASILDDGADLFIDLTGSHHCGLSHLRTWNKGAAPRVGMVLARLPDGKSANFHLFDSLRMEGATLANVVNFSSENDIWTHCELMNAEPGGMNIITGRENDLGIESPFGEVAGGSCLCHQFIGCRFGVYGHTGTEVNIVLQSGTGDMRILGGTLSNQRENKDKTQPSQAYAAAIQIGAGDFRYPCRRIVVDGLECESHGVNHAVQIVGPVRGLALTGMTLLQSLESAIRVWNTGQLLDSRIESCDLQAGMAQYDWKGEPARALMQVDGEMTDCRIDLRSRYLGLLMEDRSPNDKGERPDVALAVSHGSVCEGNEVTIRSREHIMAPGEFARDNCVQVTGD